MKFQSKFLKESYVLTLIVRNVVFILLLLQEYKSVLILKSLIKAVFDLIIA